MTKRIAVILATLAVLFAAPMSAAAQDGPYPPRAPTVTVNDPTPAPGGSFTVTVRNCIPGETVRIGFAPPFQDVICVADFPGATTGSASATFIAPVVGGLVNGTAVLVTSGITLPWSVTVQTVILTVPATGASNLTENVTMAFGLVALGGALLLVARTRRRQPALA